MFIGWRKCKNFICALQLCGVSPRPPAVALVVEKPAEADSSYQPFDDDMVGNDSCVSVVVTTCQS